MKKSLITTSAPLAIKATIFFIRAGVSFAHSASTTAGGTIHPANGPRGVLWLGVRHGGGRSRWFDTEQEARDYAKPGRRSYLLSFDCNGQEFACVCSMARHLTGAADETTI